jgi:hypothetical protein
MGNGENYPLKSSTTCTFLPVFLVIEARKMRFQVLTAVRISRLVSWIETLYGFVGKNQCFEETYCLHLQSWSPEDQHWQEERWAGLLRNKNVYNISVGKPHVRNQFGNLVIKMMINKTDLRQAQCEGTDWTKLTQDFKTKVTASGFHNR